MNGLAGVILLFMPVMLFVVELAVSPCTTGGKLQPVLAIVTFVFMMLWEMESEPMVIIFIMAVSFAVTAWGIFQPHIMYACHLHIWLMFLTHLHNLCLRAKTDFKWSFDLIRDYFRTDVPQ